MTDIEKIYCLIFFQLYLSGLTCRVEILFTNIFKNNFRQLLNCKITSQNILKRYWSAATTSYFMKFYFDKWNTSQKYDFWEKVRVKVKSRSKVMSVFVFYMWLHLWQTFETANFLYYSTLSRNTRFLISGQDFNQSLWKLVQMESTCFKTLKLQNFCKMFDERGPIMMSFSKVHFLLESFI